MGARISNFRNCHFPVSQVRGAAPLHPVGGYPSLETLLKHQLCFPGSLGLLISVSSPLLHFSGIVSQVQTHKLPRAVVSNVAGISNTH